MPFYPTVLSDLCCFCYLLILHSALPRKASLIIRRHLLEAESVGIVCRKLLPPRAQLPLDVAEVSRLTFGLGTSSVSLFFMSVILGLFSVSMAEIQVRKRAGPVSARFVRTRRHHDSV